MGGFGIGLTEFVIMGILPEISEALQVTIPEAGHFISAYALGVVVGAPLLTGMSQRWSYRKSLFFLMVWFTVFNTLSAFSTSYWMMLVFRFLSGLPHGAFFGIGAVAAGQLAREGKSAQAMAVMFSGLTIANVIGVPVGTYLGQEFHWSISFIMVGIVGLLTLASIFYWMPGMKAAISETTSLSKGLKNMEVWVLIALTTIGTGGFFAWYSYIAPLLTEIAQMPEYMVSYAMIIAGLGMVVGNFLGAKMAEWFSPLKSVAISLIFMVLILVVNSLLASYGIALLILSFVIGMITFTVVTPIQMAIVRAAKGSEKLGSSLNQSAFNMGNASGAYFGGLPMVYGYAVPYSGFVGAGLAGMGVCIAVGLLLFRRLKRSKGSLARS
ncbi:MAG: MFS transporter [Alteromonas sp.]|nr:MFS transporter [Alteromonas sp.]